MSRRGVFIVLEGPDKAGKSTQALMLAESLRKQGFKVTHTREPGGTPLAEEIREIILKPGRTVSPITELLLYEAARAQHVSEKIKPALERGEIVLCERFTLATLIYQGFGRQIPFNKIFQVDSIATGGLRPTLTIVLDIPEERFEKRMEGKTYDRIESEGKEFQRNIRSAYKANYLTEISGSRKAKLNLKWVDGNRAMVDVHEDISKLVKEHLKTLHPASSRRREEEPT